VARRARSPVAASVSHTRSPVARFRQRNCPYTIRTGANNKVAGFILSDASFHSHPAGCALRGPVTGQSTGQQYTVQ
jgi:hypothetical protein